MRKLASGRYDQAAQELNALLEEAPDDPQVLAHLGFCRFHLRAGSRMEAARRAQELIERSLKIDPDQATPHLYLARIARKQGDLDDAMIHAARAMTLAPGHAGAEDEVEQIRRQIDARGPGAATIPATAPATPPPATLNVTSSVDPLLVEALRSIADQPDERAEFAVAVARWERSGGTSSTFGGAHVPVEVKTALMRAVRESDATLLEFSRERVVAVLRSEAAEELRARAATLGDRLFAALRRLRRDNDSDGFQAWFALAMGAGSVRSLEGDIDSAVAEAARVVEGVGPWRIVAPRAMFAGFEGLVDVVDVPRRPGVVFVLGDRGAHSAVPPATPRAPSPVPPPPTTAVAGPALEPRRSALSTPLAATSVGGLSGSVGGSPDGSLGGSLGMSRSRGGTSMALSPGALLGDTYRIEGFIGAGGMGEVYRAVDVGLGRPGLGLGLALVRRIVEQHGGRVWAEPTDRPGAIVRFTLPDMEAMRA